MRSRPPIHWRVAAALVLLVAGCGDGAADQIRRTGDERSDQARSAALDAGLDEDVAAFLGLLARGDTATYQVRYPGPTEGTELIVANDPPDRRVEVLAEGITTEVRLVTGGQAFECLPADPAEDTTGAGGQPDLSCTRTDAIAEPPGAFRPEALEDLRAALADRLDDYTFEIETKAVAGIEAQCLVTRLRSGREDPELASSGTICASPEGALVLVDQGDQRLEAIGYSTDVADDAFIRPDLEEDDPDG